MSERSRDGFLRRLGRALRGVNAVEYGRPMPTSDPGPLSQPTPALIVDDPYRAPTQQEFGLEKARPDEAPRQR